MKILIIGQAPPAVHQTVPYDTTLLYEMLSWVGITKEQAQDMFEFEAMANEFPGHGTNGHMKPSNESMLAHYNNVLKEQIAKSEKVIVLGKVAKDALETFTSFRINDKAIFLIHPSKRNYSKIMASKKEIIEKLKSAL